MNVLRLAIPDVLLLEPSVFRDERGYFCESFNHRTFTEICDTEVAFVQDNHAYSKQHVLRGLHYQIRQAQGKLVWVTAGETWGVAVDLRKSSPTFGQWVSAALSAENKKQLWVPAGFAHGYLVTSDGAEVLYKTTDYWAPQHERCLAWDDPSLNIAWPLKGTPILSAKDREGKSLQAADVFA